MTPEPTSTAEQELRYRCLVMADGWRKYHDETTSTVMERADRFYTYVTRGERHPTFLTKPVKVSLWRQIQLWWGGAL